jgi:hypothetical protein
MLTKRLIVVAILAVLVTPSAAPAVSAGDVLNRMTEKERFGYITGAIDMAMYLEQVEARGSTPRSACILKWYYGTDAAGPRQVLSLFSNYSDKPATGLIKIAIDRACGK